MIWLTVYLPMMVATVLCYMVNPLIGAACLLLCVVLYQLVHRVSVLMMVSHKLHNMIEVQNSLGEFADNMSKMFKEGSENGERTRPVEVPKGD